MCSGKETYMSRKDHKEKTSAQDRAATETVDKVEEGIKKEAEKIKRDAEAEELIRREDQRKAEEKRKKTKKDPDKEITEVYKVTEEAERSVDKAEKEGTVPVKKTFGKKVLDGLKKAFNFEDRGDGTVTARKMTAMEKIMAQSEEERRKAVEKEKDNAVEETAEKKRAAYKDMTYTVGDDSFDYKNMKNAVLMKLSDVFDNIGLDRNDTFINMTDAGSGTITNRLNGHDIELASINEKHEVTINSEEKIRTEIKKSLGLESEKAPAHTEPLLTPPEETDVAALIVSKDGLHLKTVDYLDKGEAPKEAGFDEKKKQADYQARLKDAIKMFSEQAGVDPADIYLVEGCRYVVTKEGKQLGILDSNGAALCDYETIERSNALEKIGKEMNLSWGDITADNKGNITFKNDPFTVIAKFEKTDGEYKYEKTPEFDKQQAKEKAFGEFITTMKRDLEGRKPGENGYTTPIIRIDKDSYMFNEKGEIISKDHPDKPIAAPAEKEGKDTVKLGDILYSVNEKELIDIVRNTSGEFAYEDRAPYERGHENPEVIATGEIILTEPEGRETPTNYVGDLYNRDEDGNHNKIPDEPIEEKAEGKDKETEGKDRKDDTDMKSIIDQVKDLDLDALAEEFEDPEESEPEAAM